MLQKQHLVQQEELKVEMERQRDIAADQRKLREIDVLNAKRRIREKAMLRESAESLDSVRSSKVM